jgi:hypothetical protein
MRRPRILKNAVIDARILVGVRIPGNRRCDGASLERMCRRRGIMTTINSERATRSVRETTRGGLPVQTHPGLSSLGHSRSGRTRTLDGRPTPQVENLLRSLPSHGWPAGWIGRRDRALLVLAELAELHVEQIASVAAGDVTIADGAATIRTPGGTTILRGVEDDLQCGPCALARWVHALDLTVVYPDGRVIAAVIARAVPLRPDSPHLCSSNNSITEMTRRMAFLPPIDKWGHPIRAMLPPPLVPRSLNSRTVGYSVPAVADPGSAPPESADIAVRVRGLEGRLAQLLERRIGH